ncbi:MAG: hypothetical protein CMO01_21280 [Thalassobius sp.]|nr:hypothetical protein [Thalassovita sp.]
MKVVIGSGNTKYQGWYHTQEDELNLLDQNTFEKLFSNRGVAIFLAEHVWEHLTFEEGIIAAQNCFKFLKPGGLLRVAVPDRFFKNEWYQNMVQVGGPGPKDHPAASHKIVYDYKSFSQVFQEAGFNTNLLEYCDEDGCFHYKYWNQEDGMIGRSYRFDTRNSGDSLGMVSIILDAYKPLIIEP